MLDLTLTEIGERKLCDVQFMKLLYGTNVTRDLTIGAWKEKFRVLWKMNVISCADAAAAE